MAGHQRSFLVSVTIVIALILTLILGELEVRVASFFSPIYGIETLKYRDEFTVSDPTDAGRRVPRPNAHGRIMGQDVRLNSFGNRGPDLPLEKPIGVKRILMIGDSATFGWGVREEDTFSQVLESEINGKADEKTRIQVINAAHPHVDTENLRRTLLEGLDQFRPDLVLLQYYIDDIKPHSFNVSGISWFRSYLLAYLRFRWTSTRLSAGAGDNLSELYDSEFQPAGYWPVALAEIAAMAEATKLRGVPMSVLFLPDLRSPAGNSPLEKYYDRIVSDIDRIPLSVIDMRNPLKEHFGVRAADSCVQRDDCHPNSEAHRVIARELAMHLESISFITHAF